VPELVCVYGLLLVEYSLGLLWLAWTRTRRFHHPWKQERHGHVQWVVDHQSSFGLVELVLMQDGFRLLSALLERKFKKKKGSEAEKKKARVEYLRAYQFWASFAPCCGWLVAGFLGLCY